MAIVLTTNKNSIAKTGFVSPQAIEPSADALVSVRLTTEAFFQLAGNMAGYPFVKVVVDRSNGNIHFINNAKYKLHAEYIADHLLGIPRNNLLARIDEYNREFYLSCNEQRKFFLGILAYHRREERAFYSLETVEVDTMNAEMLIEFYRKVVAHVDPTLQVFLKPANHLQEEMISALTPQELPRIFSHELYASSDYVALNTGKAKGRLRTFSSEADYRARATSIEWYDILVMRRVPEDIPRVSGIINAEHTTPLSHTNVLACGWGIPNAIQLNILQRIEQEEWDGKWVAYVVEPNANAIQLELIDQPMEIPQRPAWSVHRIEMEEPDTNQTPIASLVGLRTSDRFRYGTKAANIGELRFLLEKGSPKLLGFYNVERPPRENLHGYLAQYFGLTENEDLPAAAWDFLRSNVKVPRGIAVPFSLQQEFLELSPKIQQTIGKLKMALELGAREVDALCLNLQQLIRATRIPDSMRDYIDAQITHCLSGVSSFVVRSSSNAEDLENFSAAGIYESVNHVTSAEKIFESLKHVWASLVSPRSMRLRHDVGISLNDCYMGVVIQEEIKSDLGGVLVTTNPMQPNDFRNVYINASMKSAVSVVGGTDKPLQYLFNTVEGGGRTLSLGAYSQDLSLQQKDSLQKLAFVGRLLQGHFSRDYTFSAPLDIEWTVLGEKIYILQIRPYSR